MITTFGVGELSAINGIAGAYAERKQFLDFVLTYSSNVAIFNCGSPVETWIINS